MTATALSRRTGRASAPIPRDLASAAELPDWRGDFRWPLAPDAVGRQALAAVSRMLAAADRLPREEKQAAFAAFPHLLNFATAVLEAAFCAQAERESGASLVSAEPEFAFVAGRGDAPPADALRRHVERLDKPRLPLRRSCQVTRSWASPLGIAAAAFSPDAVAVSVNALLIETARSSDRRVWFNHAGVYLAHARKRSRAAELDAGALAGLLAECWLAESPIDDDIRARATQFIQANCAPMLQAIATDLARLRDVARLPETVWSGSAGNYQARMVGQEVRRRGGKVVRFDHGGTTGMVIRPTLTAAVELHDADTFVMPTPALARTLRSSGAPDRLAPEHRPAIEGGPGELRLLNLPLVRRRPVPVRPRVVYAPTVLRGFRRYVDAAQPDTMVLDWTLRVVEALRKLPIDLLCKPHPEGLFAGRAHPVADLAPTSYRRFEEEIAAADVFVFDRCASTTFWEAVCTDRTVVYLPAAPTTIHPQVEPAFRKRCRVVEVRWDERNLPVFDERELAEAVLGDRAPADPGAFQELLIGRRAA